MLVAMVIVLIVIVMVNSVIVTVIVAVAVRHHHPQRPAGQREWSSVWAPPPQGPPARGSGLRSGHHPQRPAGQREWSSLKYTSLRMCAFSEPGSAHLRRWASIGVRETIMQSTI